MQFRKLLLSCVIALSHLRIWVNGAQGDSPPRDGQASLVIIFDITASMGDDLEELRKGAAFIVREMMRKEKNPIYNYIFVPFYDPGFGPALITRNPQELLDELNRITLIGNWDCPEMSMSGMKLALEQCLPNSFVYVFTDADEKDNHLVSDVLALIQKKKTSVTFIAAEDKCYASFKTYKTIAEKSNGQVYQIKSKDTNTILKSIGDTLDEGLQILAVINSDKPGTHKIPLEVDKNLKNITITISGSDPNITIASPSGSSSKNEKTLVDLPKVQTKKVIDPKPGTWNIDASSSSPHSIKIAGVSDVRFPFGFSLHTPLSIDETSPRPIHNSINKFCVAPSHPDAVKSIKTVRFFKDEKLNPFELVLNLEPMAGSEKISCAAFSPPPGAFKIEIKGEDSSGNKFTRILPTAVETTTVSKPQYLGKSLRQTVELAPNTSFELDCRMTGKPDPVIKWLKDGSLIVGATTEVRRIEHDNETPLVNYECLGSNSEGTSHVTFIVTNAQPVEVVDRLLKYENGSTINLLRGETLSLSCPTKGVPKPTYKWLKNGEPLHIEMDNFVITIPTVEENDIGLYECIAENPYGNITLKFTLDVEEAPRFIVDTNDTNFDSKLNRYKEKIVTKFRSLLKLQCDIEGKPKPNITWFHEDPSEIIPRKRPILHATQKLLTVRASRKLEKYFCVGKNSRGVVEKEFQIDPLQPPKFVQPRSKEIRVKPKRNFSMNCSVKAPDPKISVTWFKFGEPITLDGIKYVSTEDGYGLKVMKADTDADIGEYTCRLRNEGGESKKLFIVKRLVYIKWSSWSNWTECNCDSRDQYRMRYCQYSNGTLTDAADRDLCSGQGIDKRYCKC